MMYQFDSGIAHLFCIDTKKGLNMWTGHMTYGNFWLTEKTYNNT